MTKKDLKNLLKKTGWRQRRFADAAQVTESFLSNYLAGRIELGLLDKRLARMRAAYELLEAATQTDTRG